MQKKTSHSSRIPGLEHGARSVRTRREVKGRATRTKAPLASRCTCAADALQRCRNSADARSPSVLGSGPARSGSPGHPVHAKTEDRPRDVQRRRPRQPLRVRDVANASGGSCAAPGADAVLSVAAKLLGPPRTSKIMERTAVATARKIILLRLIGNSCTGRREPIVNRSS